MTLYCSRLTAVKKSIYLYYLLNSLGSYESCFCCVRLQKIQLFSNKNELNITLNFFDGSRFHAGFAALWSVVSDNTTYTTSPTATVTPNFQSNPSMVSKVALIGAIAGGTVFILFGIISGYFCKKKRTFHSEEDAAKFSNDFDEI